MAELRAVRVRTERIAGRRAGELGASEIEKATTKMPTRVRHPSRLAACSTPASAPRTTVVCPPNVNMKAATFWFAGVCSHAGAGGARKVANAIPETTSSATCPPARAATGVRLGP
jgi:hypothetical protein